MCVGESKASVCVCMGEQSECVYVCVCVGWARQACPAGLEIQSVHSMLDLLVYQICDLIYQICDLIYIKRLSCLFVCLSVCVFVCPN